MEASGWKMVDHRNGFIEYRTTATTTAVYGGRNHIKKRKQSVTFYRNTNGMDLAWLKLSYKLKVEGNIEYVNELKQLLCLVGLSELSEGIVVPKSAD